MLDRSGTDLDCDRERLDHGAVLERHRLGKFVDDLGRERVGRLQRAIVRRRRSEANVGAELVGAAPAVHTGLAGRPGLERDRIADLERATRLGQVLAERDDDAGRLVA